MRCQVIFGACVQRDGVTVTAGLLQGAAVPVAGPCAGVRNSFSTDSVKSNAGFGVAALPRQQCCSVAALRSGCDAESYEQLQGSGCR